MSPYDLIMYGNLQLIPVSLCPNLSLISYRLLSIFPSVITNL